ncbi:hypothetical protein EU78_21950 [Mycolicibacterium rufum]|nr:hypothetical protein EU78_21950 [Mycolicibacterium rufum]
MAGAFLLVGHPRREPTPSGQELQREQYRQRGKQLAHRQHGVAPPTERAVLPQVAVQRLQADQPVAEMDQPEEQALHRCAVAVVEDLGEGRERERNTPRAMASGPLDHVDGEAFVHPVDRIRHPPGHVE